MSVNAQGATAASSVPVDEIRAGLSNGVLEGAGDCEGGADAQAEAEDAAVELPQAVLEAVAAAKALDAAAAGGHGGLLGEEAIDDEGVDGDDDGGGAHDEDAEQGDGDALLFGEGIVEGVVLEGEGLVEGRDLVDDGEGPDEDDDDEVVDNVREDDALGQALLGEGQALRQLVLGPLVHGGEAARRRGCEGDEGG